MQDHYFTMTIYSHIYPALTSNRLRLHSSHTLLVAQLLWTAGAARPATVARHPVARRYHRRDSGLVVAVAARH